MDNSHKLSIQTKIGYGIGAVGDGAAYDFIISFMMFYLTTIAGISPVVAGTISSIAIIWDGITDPIIGTMIDKSKLKWGKRRPFILMAAFPLAISIVLLFSNFGLTGSQKNIFYGFMVILFWTAYTVFNIPYYALGASITPDDNERTKLSALRQAFNFVGIFIATSGATFLVGKLTERGIATSTAWTYAATMVAITILISLLIVWRSTRGKEDPQEYKHHLHEKNLFKDIKEIMSIKPYLLIVISATSYCIANTFFFADLMYYTSFILQVSEAQAAILFTLITAISIGMIPILTKLAIALDKRDIFIWAMILSGIGMILMRWIPTKTLTTAIIHVAIFSIGSATYWMFIFNLIYDVVDLDEYETGKRRDGIIFSYYSFILKLGGAIATWSMGVALAWGGFNESAVTQSEKTLGVIVSLFTVVPGIFTVLTGAVILLSPLTKKKMIEIQKALETKKNEEA